MKALTILGFLVLFPVARALVRALDRRHRTASYGRAVWPERAE